VINVHVTAMLTGKDLDDAAGIAGQALYRPPGQ